MAIDTTLLIYNRVKGAVGQAGPPPTTGLGAPERGLVAVNFNGNDAVDHAANKVALYMFDGGSWIHTNPTAAVTTQSIPLISGPEAAAANVGAAYAINSVALTGDVILATWGSPTPGAYLLTNKAAPTAAASWTSLGSAVAFAVAADASTGTDTTKALNSGVLRGELTRLFPGTTWTARMTSVAGGVAGDAGRMILLDAAGLIPATALPLADAADMTTGTEAAKLVTPKLERDELARALTLPAAKLAAATATLNAPSGTPANDVNALVRLNAAGKIDAGFLAVSGVNFIGAVDVTAAPAGAATTAKAGDFVTANAAGTIAAGWTGAAGSTAKIGDMLMSDGTGTWHLMEQALDVTEFVRKGASNAMLAAAKLLWADPGTADTVIIDGAVAANAVAQNLTLKTCVIGGGTFIWATALIGGALLFEQLSPVISAMSGTL